MALMMCQWHMKNAPKEQNFKKKYASKSAWFLCIYFFHPPKEFKNSQKMRSFKFSCEPSSDSPCIEDIYAPDSIVNDFLDTLQNYGHSSNMWPTSPTFWPFILVKFCLHIKYLTRTVAYSKCRIEIYHVTYRTKVMAWPVWFILEFWINILHFVLWYISLLSFEMLLCITFKTIKDVMSTSILVLHSQGTCCNISKRENIKVVINFWQINNKLRISWNYSVMKYNNFAL